MAEADPAPLSPAQRRPLSPHLQIYKMTPTMVVSGAHRITGVLLYIGTLLLVWFLLAAASGKGAFEIASAFFGSFLGQLILFGYTFALMLHAMGGIRHAIWDANVGWEPENRDPLAYASLGGAGILTILIWIAVFILR